MNKNGTIPAGRGLGKRRRNHCPPRNKRWKNEGQEGKEKKERVTNARKNRAEREPGRKGGNLAVESRTFSYCVYAQMHIIAGPDSPCVRSERKYVCTCIYFLGEARRGAPVVPGPIKPRYACTRWPTMRLDRFFHISAYIDNTLALGLANTRNLRILRSVPAASHIPPLSRLSSFGISSVGLSRNENDDDGAASSKARRACRCSRQPMDWLKY